MKKFVSYFPNYHDYHFFKDPGQIPYRFSSMGYDTSILTFKNEKEYPNTVKYCKIKFLTTSIESAKNNKIVLRYLFKNSKNIDILNVYHVDWTSLLAAYFFKLFNNKGITYLKMDNCCYTTHYEWEKILISPFYDWNYKQWFKRFLIKNILIKKIDFFSVEDNDSLNRYSRYKEIQNKIFCAYNGYTNDMFNATSTTKFQDKENIILTVGNIGNYSKANDILMDAFAKTASRSNWTLHMAGPVNPEFKPFINDFFIKNPDLKDRIIFHGMLSKELLFSLYNRTKLFILASRWEGFANVFGEAMYYKNAIITSKFVSPREIIRNKCGLVIDELDSSSLAAAILKLIQDPDLLEAYGNNSHDFAVKHLNWDKIAQNIEHKLTSK